MATFQIVVNNQVIGVIDTLGNGQPVSSSQGPAVVADATPPTLNAGASPTTALAPTMVGTSFIANPS